jgi:hypothetical protein
MRGALHVLATLVLAPYAVLALGFLLLGNAISTGSIGGFFLRLLDFFLVLVPWGMLGLLAMFLTVAGLGMVERTRRTGGALVAAIGAACMATIAIVPDAALEADALFFLLPCAAAAAFGAWTAAGSPAGAPPLEEPAA